jgi:hypothetical protein
MRVLLPFLQWRAYVDASNTPARLAFFRNQRVRPTLPALSNSSNRDGSSGNPGSGSLAGLCLGLVILIGSTGCSVSNYMGIPLARGAADAGVSQPAIQALAARARAGDKRAQFELAERFENGRGVPQDHHRARALLTAAAKDRGGTRMMFVPRNGAISTVPVSSGARIPGLPEAKAELTRLDQAGSRSSSESTTVPDPRNSQNELGAIRTDDKGRESIFDGSTGSVFSTVVKIEVFSEKCLIRGKSYTEDHRIYAEKAWKCLLESELPKDCASYPDAILRSVRFIRFHPNFVAVHKLMPRVIEQCLAHYRGTADSAYNNVDHAGVFDIILDDLGHATPRQKKLVEGFRESSLAHSSNPMLPGYEFSREICSKLINQESIERADFWLLLCNSENGAFVIRADRADLIDKIMRERGF